MDGDSVGGASTYRGATVRDRLRTDLFELEQRARIISKSHFYDGLRLETLNRILGLVAAGLAGFAGVAATVSFDQHAAVAALLAFLAAGVTTLTIALNAGERAARHQVASGQMAQVRHRAHNVLLRTYRDNGESDERLYDEYTSLMSLYDELSFSHPKVTDKGYRRACADPRGRVLTAPDEPPKFVKTSTEGDFEFPLDYGQLVATAKRRRRG